MSTSFDTLYDGLADDTMDFWVGGVVPVIHKPTEMQFMREAVSAYRPVILTGLLDDWPAMTKWNTRFFCESMGDRRVSINLSPDGHADCIKHLPADSGVSSACEPGSSSDSSDRFTAGDYFVYPAEHEMPLREFFSLLENSDGAARWVPYLSQQNDNLRQHLPELLQDIQPSLAIADAVFAPSSDVDYLSSGCGLEAVNLWIGDHRSVSSIHKDHYENMYAVVSGEKTFTLLPPTDVAHIGRYVKEYPTLRYAVKQHSSRGGQEDSHRHSSGASVSGSSSGPEDKDLELRADGCPSERLEWLPLDPEDPEVSSRYPAFRRTSPLRVTVRAGEVLYIPAMWYHRVSQTCLTIAVNYWYDQRFDFRYVFYQSMKRISELAAAEETDDDA